MIGLYALEECTEMAAFAEGLKAASLHYKWRNHNLFTPDQVEDFSAAVVSGLRAQGAVVRDSYRNTGVPVLVMDYGYLNRVYGMATWQTGHWQLGLNRLGWVPPSTCPSDRFDRLGISLRPRHKGEAVLICGQHAGDPSHGLDSDGLSRWASGIIAQVKRYYSGPVLWRPHPDSPNVVASGHDGIHTGPIEWDYVHAVVCINSNVGLDALVNGVPVFCRDDAPYAALGNSSLSMIQSPYFPDDGLRLDYLARVAYAQWTLDEFRQGLPIDFLWSNYL